MCILINLAIKSAWPVCKIKPNKSREFTHSRHVATVSGLSIPFDTVIFSNCFANTNAPRLIERTQIWLDTVPSVIATNSHWTRVSPSWPLSSTCLRISAKSGVRRERALGTSWGCVDDVVRPRSWNIPFILTFFEGSKSNSGLQSRWKSLISQGSIPM